MKRIEHKPRDSKEVVRLHALHKCVHTVPLRIDSDGWPPKGAVGRWRTNGGMGANRDRGGKQVGLTTGWRSHTAGQVCERVWLRACQKDHNLGG